jgi:hypothetical protein
MQHYPLVGWAGAGGAIVMIVLVLLSILLLILWTLLPFAVFGIKPRLSNLEARLGDLQKEVQWTNYLLKVGFDLHETRDPAGGAHWSRGKPPDTPPA